MDSSFRVDVQEAYQGPSRSFGEHQNTGYVSESLVLRQYVRESKIPKRREAGSIMPGPSFSRLAGLVNDANRVNRALLVGAKSSDSYPRTMGIRMFVRSARGFGSVTRVNPKKLPGFLFYWTCGATGSKTA